MRTFKTTMIMMGLVALTGCSSFLKQHPDTYIKQPTVCVDKGWYGYYQGSGCPSTKKAVAPDASADNLAALERERQQLAHELAEARRQNGDLSSRVSELERQLAAAQSVLSQSQGEKDRLAAELDAAKIHGEDHDRLAAEMQGQLAAAKQRNTDLEGQLAEREKELTGLRGDLSAEMAKLKEAERGLIRSLGPQIKKGDITVHLNDERLLINLASGYLFASGQDQLKPAGTDALKQVGAILKDYPEYKVAVDGHTDNQLIGGALKKKFPTNMELSEARAVNAARALEEGGLSNATTQGYADTKPKGPNTTEAGRAKNRRVEVLVTK